MSNVRGIGAFAAAAALVAASLSCTKAPSSNTTLQVFEEATSLPADAASGGSLLTTIPMKAGILASIAPVDRIELVVDAPVEASYKGFTTCERGCVGSGPDSAEEEATMAKGREGTLPIPMSKLEGALRLIFALRLSATEYPRLAQAHCLGITAVRFHGLGGWVTGVSHRPFVAALRDTQDRLCVIAE